MDLWSGSQPMGILENGQREIDRPPGRNFLRTIATDADVNVVVVSAW
jgi:hypothetical protein